MDALIGQQTCNNAMFTNSHIATVDYLVKPYQGNQLKRHNYHQIMLFNQVGFALRLTGRELCASENSCYLVPQGVAHSVHREQPGLIQCICFKAAIPDNDVHPVKLNNVVRELIREITKEQNSGESLLMLESCLYDQLGKMLWTEKQPFEIRNRFLRKACEIIYENPAADMTMGELASRIGVSDRTLRRLAREHLGCGLSELRTRCRINEASRLLQDDMPISHVCESVGYTSESAFYRAFKTVTGITPQQFRNSG